LKREPTILIVETEPISVESVAPNREAVRSLVGRGSLYAGAMGLQLGASLIAIPIATRLLSPAQYGVVALGLIVLLLLGGFGAAGLPIVVTRTFYDEAGPAQARAMFPLAGGVALLCCVVSEGLSFVWLPALGRVPDQAAIHVAIWTVLPSTLTGMCEAYLRVAERARSFVALALMAGPGGQFMGILLVVIVPHGGPTEYMLGVAGGWVAAAVVGLMIVRPWHERAILTRQSIRSWLAVGIPLIPHGIAWTLLALGDRTVIQSVDGSGQVGRYQVAYTVGALGLTLVTAIANAWAPIVFRSADDRRWAVHRETLATIQTVAAFAAATLALLGPPLLVVATPGAYGEGALRGVVAFVAASTFPWVIYGSGTQVLVWSKRTAPLAWITPLAAVTNLILVALLLHPFGLTGAAAATLIAYAVLAGLVWRRASQVAPTREFGSAALVPWGVAGILIALGGLMPTSGVWLALRIALLVPVAAGALSRLSQMTSIDGSGARTVAIRVLTRLDIRVLAVFVLAFGLVLIVALGISRSIYPWGLGPSEATGWVPAELMLHLHNPYAVRLAVTAPYVASAYGPVYYLVLGAGLRLFGEQFVAFRILSLLCTLFVAGSIGWITYCFTRRRWAGALGAGLFLLQWPVGYWVSIQREDLLALALAFAAFALVVRPRGVNAERGCGRPYLAGSLAGAALLTRQTEVLPLLFVLAWTLRTGRRRHFLAMTAGAFTTIGPLVTLLELTSHGGFLTTLYSNQTGASTSLANLRSVLQDLAESPVTWVTLGMLVPVSRWLYVTRTRASAQSPDFDDGHSTGPLLPGRWELGVALAAYFLLASGIGIISCTHLGSNVNYLLEPTAIAVLLVSVVAGGTAELPRSALWRLAIGVLVLGSLIDFARLGRGELHYWHANSYFNRLVTDVRRLTPPGKPITSVMPELASAADRPNYFNDSSQYDGRVPAYERLFLAVKSSGELSAIIQFSPVPPPHYHGVVVSLDAPGGIYVPFLFVRTRR
jgi:O-antigen/teichoic acid export membrane protein